jgi:hypothetical protein
MVAVGSDEGGIRGEAFRGELSGIEHIDQLPLGKSPARIGCSGRST